MRVVYGQHIVSINAYCCLTMKTRLLESAHGYRVAAVFSLSACCVNIPSSIFAWFSPGWLLPFSEMWKSPIEIIDFQKSTSWRFFQDFCYITGVRRALHMLNVILKGSKHCFNTFQPCLNLLKPPLKSSNTGCRLGNCHLWMSMHCELL